MIVQPFCSIPLPWAFSSYYFLIHLCMVWDTREGCPHAGVPTTAWLLRKLCAEKVKLHRRGKQILETISLEKKVIAIHFTNSHGSCYLLHEGELGIKKVGITVSYSAQNYTIALIFFSEMPVCSVMTFVLIVL